MRLAEKVQRVEYVISGTPQRRDQLFSHVRDKKRWREGLEESEDNYEMYDICRSVCQ